MAERLESEDDWFKMIMKTISKWYNYEEVFYDGHRYDYDDNRIC